MKNWPGTRTGTKQDDSSMKSSVYRLQLKVGQMPKPKSADSTSKNRPALAVFLYIMTMMRLFFVFHATAIALLASLFLLPSREVWQSIDTASFEFLNSSILGHPLQQAFWAISNIKITDVYGASFLLGLFLLYIFEAEGQERKKRIAQLIYTLVWFEIGILFAKQCITPICEYLRLSRHSPTVMLKASLMLSEVAPWAKIKDSSYFCFPADHACIIFQWCSFLWIFTGWKRGLTAFFLSIPFVLPRLISGAHWLSDLLVGSMSIVLIVLSYALYSPLFSWGMRFLYRIVKFQPPLPSGASDA
jgi:membrane-associated phospholipid phosphatase